MKVTYVDKLNLNDYELKGKGHEGKVFKINNNKVIKIYNNPTEKLLKKAILLDKKNIKSFIKPIEIIKINGSKKPFDAMISKEVNNTCDIRKKIDSLKNLSDKIVILKKQEEIFMSAHKNDVVLLDLNPQNFLIDNNNINVIDTIGGQIDDIKSDLKPYYFYEYYIEKVDKEITPDTDKMFFALFLLYYLGNDRKFIYKVSHYDNTKFIENYINSLNMNKEVKEKLLEMVSDSKNKPYLGDTINLLKSDEEYIKKI